MNTGLLRHAVATVLTVYGIETCRKLSPVASWNVATVLTVYGIETTEPLMMVIRHTSCNSAYRLRY